MQTSYIRISTPRPLLSRIPVCIPSTKPFRKGMPFSVPQASRLAPWKKKKKVKKEKKGEKQERKKKNGGAFQLDRPAIKTDILIVCIHIGKVLQIFQA